MDDRHSPGVPGEIAGFRLVRRLAVGGQSEVFLGRPPGGVEEAAPTAPRAAVVKLYRLEADGRGIDRQVRAMLAVPPGALARLADVSTLPDGRVCLVLERLAGVSLSTLLAARGPIGSGEVVTILATVTTSVQALHDAGFSHPAVDPGCVRFDGSGRPVLLGLGALGDLPPGAAAVGRKRDDLVRLAGFARSVMDHLDHGSPEFSTSDTVLAAFEEAATVRPYPADLTGLEAALFTWAAATAVDGAVTGAPAEPAGKLAVGAVPAEVVLAGAVLARAVPAGAAHTGAAHTGAALVSEQTVLAPTTRPVRGPERPEARARATVPARELGRATRLVRSGLVRRFARWCGDTFAQWRARTSARWSAQWGDVWRRSPDSGAQGPTGERGGVDGAGTVRRRLNRAPMVVGLGVAAVLTAGALTVLSWSDSPAAPGAEAGESPAPAEAPDTTPLSTLEPGTAGPDAGAPGGGGPPASLMADDPAAAVLDLLRLRETCFADASVLCLDGVDQAGSVAMAADSFGVREQQAAGADASASPMLGGTVAGATATVQERTGNAALVVLVRAGEEGTQTQPASALVIKGEAGWRLRELFDY